MPKLRWLWPQAPIVLDELEIMSVALERRLQALGPNPQVERDLARWKRFERRIWTEADVVLTVSAEEAAVVDDTVGTPKARIVPNGVDLGFFRFEERRPSKTLIFLGNLAHSPNAIGLDRFLREVWPEVSLRNPGVGLEIVGDGASPALLRYADQNVRFIGFVDDVRDSMARAALMVVPIVSGGGTRLKVLEAMAAGVPVVSTPLGCEGLGVRDGEHVVLAELDKPFADAVVRALEQFAEARRIAANARRHVEAHFSWDAVGERLE